MSYAGSKQDHVAHADRGQDLRADTVTRTLRGRSCAFGRRTVARLHDAGPTRHRVGKRGASGSRIITITPRPSFETPHGGSELARPRGTCIGQHVVQYIHRMHRHQHWISVEIALHQGDVRACATVVGIDGELELGRRNRLSKVVSRGALERCVVAPAIGRSGPAMVPIVQPGTARTAPDRRAAPCCRRRSALADDPGRLQPGRAVPRQPRLDGRCAPSTPPFARHRGKT